MTRIAFQEESDGAETMKQQNSQPCRKSKSSSNIATVLSFICSFVGTNIFIALYDGRIFGRNSPDVIFNCAFAFLLASVILGILAMILSASKSELWQMSDRWISRYPRLFGSGLYHRRGNIYNKMNRDSENIAVDTRVIGETPSERKPLQKNIQTLKYPEVTSSQVQRTDGGLSTHSLKDKMPVTQFKNNHYGDKCLVHVMNRPMSSVFGQTITEQGYGKPQISSFILNDASSHRKMFSSVSRGNDFISEYCYETRDLLKMQRQSFTQRSLYKNRYPCSLTSSYEMLITDATGDRRFELRERFISSRANIIPEVDQFSDVRSKLNALQFVS